MPIDDDNGAGTPAGPTDVPAFPVGDEIPDGPCLECDGSGEDDDGGPCPHCDGTGTADD